MFNKNLTNCDYCFTKVEDLFTITLPCGYVVCSVHLESDDVLTKCVVCSEHTFDKSACYEMAKNSSKQKELNFRKKITLVKEKIVRIDNYFEDPDKFIDEYLDNVKNEVTDRAQELKNNFDQQISDYENNLRKQVEIFKKEILDKMEENNFDKAKIDKLCQLESLYDLDLKSFGKALEEKLNKLENKEEEFIDPALDLINKVKSAKLEFEEFNKELDLKKYFGSLNII